MAAYGEVFMATVTVGNSAAGIFCRGASLQRSSIKLVLSAQKALSSSSCSPAGSSAPGSAARELASRDPQAAPSTRHGTFTRNIALGVRRVLLPFSRIGASPCRST
jgi:hypothetical protein